MRLKKIGYLLMLIGLFLPLSVLTSMVSQRFKEHRRYQELTDRLTIDEKVLNTYHESIKAEDVAVIDPFAEKSVTKGTEEVASLENEVIGYLTIPSLDIKQPIFVGASEQHLNDGVASVLGTSLPVGGIGNRSVIAGHRSLYNDLKFFRLGEMKAGDPIYVEIQDQVLVYLVQEVVLIKATEWEKLLPFEDQDMLTLLTCDPLIPPFDYRLLVNATRRVDVLQSDEEQEEMVKEVATVQTSNPYNLLFYMMVMGWGLFLMILYYFYRLLRGELSLKEPPVISR